MSDDNAALAGCSFSIHPMSDNFVELITKAIDKTDTSKTWTQTDKVSTIVRGRMAHVLDVSQSVLAHTAQSGKHVAFHATYSVGCPGDTKGHSYMAESDELMNISANKRLSLDVAAKFALYPMDGGDYMDTIYEQIENMKSFGVKVTPTHYETRLDGNSHDIFKGLHSVFQKTKEAGSNHTVMTVSISANSPT
ncbi:YkoF family thiamine/hydroxymethylpyrimidine-binding protein [Fodinibius sp. N2]|uniref:YkoF family thiamine/hydroxymethylpyrimidine-binding protein n=1 Tax=Fodinibius alkaliphilus TaxID=3140241 RepID=UPI00315A584C